MRILIFRAGAYGDSLIITPIIRYLHSQGHELYVVTGKRGMEVFKNNPHIKQLIAHKEETPVEKLAETIDYFKRKNKCERVIDFSESVEVALSLHPRSPEYKLSKPEKLARYNRNFYEYSFEHAKEKRDECNLIPELFFSSWELDEVHKYLKPNHFNILLGMSGSGNNKAWPWNDHLAEAICNTYPDAHIITVGDEKCRLIEPEIDGIITNLSGKITMRQSMALTSMVDLVIAPDTGIIHAAGCYSTPKICLLGHTTKENITKHFLNDYSIESDEKLAPCSPCLSLVYDIKLQCPRHEPTGAVYCMQFGLPWERVFEKVKEVYASSQKAS